MLSSCCCIYYWKSDPSPRKGILDEFQIFYLIPFFFKKANLQLALLAGYASSLEKLPDGKSPVLFKDFWAKTGCPAAFSMLDASIFLRYNSYV